MIEEWRLIDSGPADAFCNMALDEAIATEARKGTVPPTLRLYGWDKPSLTIGSFQKFSGLNIEYCLSANIPVVRRPTGGRAILHGDELTYSFSAGTVSGLFSHGLLDSYKKISSAFTLAFKKIGITAEPKPDQEKGRVLSRSPHCFQSISFGEILLDDKKLMGSAQKRWIDGLLQQGSIPYSSDEEKIVLIFGAGAASLRNRMIPLKKIQSAFDEIEFKKAIFTSFEEYFGIRLLLSAPTEEEYLRASELRDRKYLQPHWNSGQ
jgi:lipoyl(octanoyl) transferase